MLISVIGSDLSGEGTSVPRLSIVVLSHNRADVLETHLAYLLEVAPPRNAEVIVVDNGSTDGTRPMLDRLHATHSCLRVALTDRNLGVAAGRNLGIGMARGAIVLSLDDDAILAAESWDAAVDAFRVDRNLGVLAPRVVHGEDGAEQGYMGNDGDEIANFHGAGHLLRVDAFRQAGRYDEYCSFGGEEIDLSMRLRSLGYVTRFSESLVVRHFSLVRPGRVGLDRHLRWVRSFAYVFAKNLSCWQAARLTLRQQVSYLVHSGRYNSRFAWARILRACAGGFSEGRRAHAPISEPARAFYRDPNLRPEFGNAALVPKIWGVISRSRGTIRSTVSPRCGRDS